MSTNDATQREHLKALIYDAEQARDYLTADRLRAILVDEAQFCAWLDGSLGMAAPGARRYTIKGES